MNNARVLVVEDDQNLRFVIKDNLSLQGYQVTACADGEQAWHTFQHQPFDICILDVMLPKLDGFSLAHQIRQQDTHTPILFLTARSLPEDKLNGFQNGADDYIVKPFDMQELIMRMEVFLKRSKRLDFSQEKYQLGQYIFHYVNLKLDHPHQSRKLTQKEADILKMLCDHQGQLLKREYILKEVWGDDDYFLGRSMDVFISRLRKYLKHDPRIAISNHHGVGFLLTLSE